MAPIRFTLNGKSTVVDGLPAETTLLRYLRDHRRLTGTKEGCAEGDCGACTVALLEQTPAGETTWRAVNSCLMLMPSLHDRTIVTVEGLAAPSGALHPAQKAMVDHLGSQCGYCTPGFVMSIFEGCYRDDMADPAKQDDQICGNLCRCTGYRPIRDALAEVAGSQPDDAFQEALQQPPQPLTAMAYTDAAAHRFLRPTTLDALAEHMAANPRARVVAGTTDLGLEITKRNARFPCLISVEGITEIQRIEPGEDGITLGAGVRLSDIEDTCGDTLPSLVRMLRYFASRQIKSRATLGGNLCNASPIGDTAPVLLSLGAVAILHGASGTRRVPLDEFFLSYRKTALQPGEILSGIFVPRCADTDKVAAYKVSKRRELDISAICAGMWLRLDSQGRVEDVRLAYGGMAATPARARNTEAALMGKVWGEGAARQAASALRADFQPIDDHRGSAWYRATVAENLLLGFALEQRETLPARSTGTVLVTHFGDRA